MNVRDLALLELLPPALAIAANPPAVVAVIVLLSSPGSGPTAPSFAAGWLAGLLAAAAVALGAQDLSAPWSAPHRLTPYLQLAIGAALVALALRQWRAHRAAAPSEDLPGWMRPIVGFSATRAFAVAAAFAAFNPKTLALNVAGTTLIADAALPAAREWLTLLVFVLLSSVTIALPLVAHWLAPRTSRRALEAAKRWLVAHNATVTATVLLLLGVYLLAAGGRALSGAA